MKKALRGGLLAVLFFAPLLLLAGPLAAQGGGETAEDECEANTICEEITVTGNNWNIPSSGGHPGYSGGLNNTGGGTPQPPCYSDCLGLPEPYPPAPPRDIHDDAAAIADLIVGACGIIMSMEDGLGNSVILAGILAALSRVPGGAAFVAILAGAAEAAISFCEGF